MKAHKPRRARRRHGLGVDGVKALIEAQGGGCAICGTPYADTPGQRLALDHDHRHHPGKIGCPECVRGMLCHACNNILRLAKDDPALLYKAIAYLEQWQQEGAA
jgi:Recombination endonuclease VII